MLNTDTNKQFDIILFGATSFVGKIVAKHIQQLITQQSPSLPNSFSWAIAGRNIARLHALKTQLGDSAKTLTILTASADNENDMRSLCNQGRVIISTVGPYALYGEALVKACAETGTDYCDLTGEPHWIKRMIDRYENTAKENGARIVHCCGFDAIPSDLGVFYTQQQFAINANSLNANDSTPSLTAIKMGVKAMKGSFSGGTIASGINAAKEAMKDKNLRKQLANPYSLCPDNHNFSARQPKYKNEFDQSFQSWLAPFIMASINTRVVHRSNALLNNAYGSQFLYSENMLMGKNGKWKSKFLSFGMVIFGIVITLPPTRWLAQKTILPKPGEGPTPKQQEEGYFDIRFKGLVNEEVKITTKVTGDKDPGYGSTGKMLTQAALCIACDLKPEQQGGMFTPASLLGSPLIERLEKYAGLTFSILDN